MLLYPGNSSTRNDQKYISGHAHALNVGCACARIKPCFRMRSIGTELVLNEASLRGPEVAGSSKVVVFKMPGS